MVAAHCPARDHNILDGQYDYVGSDGENCRDARREESAPSKSNANARGSQQLVGEDERVYRSGKRMRAFDERQR
jgi:hypothetical protein